MAMSRIIEILAQFDSKAFSKAKANGQPLSEKVRGDIKQLIALLDAYASDVSELLKNGKIVGNDEEAILAEQLLALEMPTSAQLNQIQLKKDQHNLLELLADEIRAHHGAAGITFSQRIQAPIEELITLGAISPAAIESMRNMVEITPITEDMEGTARGREAKLAEALRKDLESREPGLTAVLRKDLATLTSDKELKELGRVAEKAQTCLSLLAADYFAELDVEKEASLIEANSLARIEIDGTLKHLKDVTDVRIDLQEVKRVAQAYKAKPDGVFFAIKFSPVTQRVYDCLTSNDVYKTVRTAEKVSKELRKSVPSLQRVREAAGILHKRGSILAATLEVDNALHGFGLASARSYLSSFVASRITAQASMDGVDLRSLKQMVATTHNANIIDVLTNSTAQTAAAAVSAFKSIQKKDDEVAKAVELNNRLFELQKNFDKNAENYQAQLEQAIQACQQAEDFKHVKELEAAISAGSVKEEDLEDGLAQIARHCEGVLKEIETQARKEIDYNQYVLAKQNIRPVEQILSESENNKKFSPKVQEALERYRAVSALHEACKKDSVASTNSTPRSAAARYVATCRQVERMPAGSITQRLKNAIIYILKWAIASPAERARLSANAHAGVVLEKTGIFKQININAVKRPRSASMPNLSATNKMDNAGKPRSSSASSTPRSLSEPSSPVGSPDKEESILRRNLRRLG